MIDNTNLLESLITQDTIRLRDAEFLQKTPDPLPPDFNFNKVEGMLLGVAIGDALGATTEGKSPEKRHQRYGEITDYIAGEHSGYKPIGMPTDDTQLTFWTLKQLIADNGLIPDNLAKRFCKHHIIGIGHATTNFVINYKDIHKPWYRAGTDALGNGSLMRISPIIIPHLKKPQKSMYADAALDTMITHNAYANTATCVSFINILWLLLSMKFPPEPQWWIDTYCSVAEKLEGNSEYIPRSRRYNNYKGPLWQFTQKLVTDALHRKLTVMQACNEWDSGEHLFETVPSVLYILAKHAQDGEEAVIRAVNDTKDNDSIAAIVGAAIGALYGLKCFPDRWIKGLTGRTRSGDNGEVFRLILLAKRAFWY
jgi:ADP-ribosylglycohydrolase